MELEVKKVEDIHGSIVDLEFYSSMSDDEYAEAMGYDGGVYEGLLDSTADSELLLGVYDGDFCVALVGVTRTVVSFVDHYQIWTHTSTIIRRRPEILIPAMEQVMSLVDEQYPSEMISSIYRLNDPTIEKLAVSAGFEPDYTVDIKGIKHRVAWR